MNLWCLDEEGLTSEMKGTETYDREHTAALSKAQTMSLVGMAGDGVVSLGGVLLVVLALRKKKPVVAPPV